MLQIAGAEVVEEEGERVEMKIEMRRKMKRKVKRVQVMEEVVVGAEEVEDSSGDIAQDI